MQLSGKKVLVGMTGGIACYKIPYLVRSLRKADVEVQVVMTEAATKFITPLTLESITDKPVPFRMFPDERYVSTRHIDLGEWPDLVFVGPTTANFIGKVASGICDDLLTTIICATPRPVMIAPAMNPGMWSNPITRRNVQTLMQLGYRFVDPTEGNMACDHYGVGRMAEPDQLFEAIKTYFEELSTTSDLSGKTVVVTAGPTREAIDPVRYISNHSSGRMGYALAEAAVRAGANTILLSGPTGLPTPGGVERHDFVTTDDLHSQLSGLMDRLDCLIMAAAPADFKPSQVASQKIKKSTQVGDIGLIPTVDILRELGQKKRNGQVLVGFALETEQGIENARRKLTEKNLDLIVLNAPGEQTGFDHPTNQLTLISPNGEPETWPLDEKRALAVKLLDRIASMM